MVLSKTDIIVYVICGQHSLFHRWRTSPETCQVQIKAWNPTCIAKGPKQIAWSRVVKYLTRTSPHHPTLGWPRTIFGWCLNPHKMGQCPIPDPVDPSKMAPSLGVRTPNLDNCHLDSAWPSRPATVLEPSHCNSGRFHIWVCPKTAAIKSNYQYPDIQWFKPLQPHVLPLKKDICCKVCSQHLPGVEIWQISQNYPFPLLVAIMYLQEVGATLYVIDCVCYIPSIIPWLSLEISMKSPCALFESTINTPAPDLRSNCTKWGKNPVEVDVLAKQRSRRWVEFWDTKKTWWELDWNSKLSTTQKPWFYMYHYSVKKWCCSTQNWTTRCKEVIGSASYQWKLCQ